MTIKDLLDLISEKSKELQKLIDLYHKKMENMSNHPIVKVVEKMFDEAMEMSKKKDKDNENNKS